MKVPSPGESISEVEILEWLVKDGDYVEKDQTIAEIDSDKATLELPAEESGTIKILAHDGQIVKVGEVICKINTKEKKESKKNESIIEEEFSPLGIQETDKEDPLEEDEFKITPLASAMMNEHDIDSEELKDIVETRKIKKTDIEQILKREDSLGKRKTFRKKMSSLRRKISRRLVAVKNETAMLTTFNEVDMSSIMEIREKYKNKFKKKHAVNLGFMSFFTKAVTNAMLDFNDVNSMIDGEEIIYHTYSDIGIAVSTPKGLMVPVLRNAETMSFKDIESEINRLAIKAREGKIAIDDMLGGTFTITNGGVFGSMLSTPIINPPQSAILGMHNIVERPIVANGKIIVRPIMYIALSYDHRVIDGRESVGFLCRVKECLENPKQYLMLDDIAKALEL